MSREPDQCLSPQTLVSYANGDLSEGEKAEVDRHLDECRLCAAAMEGVAALDSRQDYLAGADSVRTRLRLRAASALPLVRESRFRAWSSRPYLALAASVVVLVGVTAYLMRPGPAEALFWQHFEPYPSNQPLVRDAASGAASEALLLYETRDYRGALAGFQEARRSRPTDPAARFYAGVCELALGRSANAISHFEEARTLGAGELEGPAEWYVALAYLLRGDVDEARSRLTRIADAPGFYADRARALLRDLAGS